jgi:Rrf2 family protein
MKVGLKCAAPWYNEVRSGRFQINRLLAPLAMLRLTKKADYSLIALRHFAMLLQQTGNAVSAKEVADSCGIPLPVLSKLLQKLGKSGFLKSEYGTNGGYRLARDPNLISALEVIRAIDGPIVLANCFTESAYCGHSSRCTVKRPLRKIHEGILRLLDGVSIQDMLQEPEEEKSQSLTSSPLVTLAITPKPVESHSCFQK